MVILQEEIHDVAHDQAGDHDRQVHDGTQQIVGLELAIHQQRQRQTKDILEQGGTEAVEKGIEEGIDEFFIRKQTEIILQSDKFHVLGITVPLEQRDKHAPEQRVDDKTHHHSKGGYIEEIHVSPDFFHLHILAFLCVGKLSGTSFF